MNKIVVILVCLVVIVLTAVFIFRVVRAYRVGSLTVASSSAKPILTAITEEFSKKYNKPLDAFSLTVDIERDNYAKGSVRFKGEMGGAIWFAAKTNGTWKLVSDGQGPMSCESANSYNFPKDLVPGCIDTKNGNIFMQR